VRQVVLSVYTTLDGVMQAPEKWVFPFWNEEHGRYARDLLFASDALLLGRETYEIFAGSWPLRTAADDGPGADGFVDRINTMPKFVASTTLQGPLTWNNSQLIKGDVAAAVASLKQQPGQDILMYGAGPLARTLLQHGLLDDLRVWLYPIVWGSGERLFNSASNLPALQLVDTKTFTSGVVVLSYRPDKKA
jgi:dihydrofolate reductase